MTNTIPDLLTKETTLQTIPLISNQYVNNMEPENPVYLKTLSILNNLGLETMKEKEHKLIKYSQTQDLVYGLNHEVIEFLNYVKNTHGFLDKCLVDDSATKPNLLNVVITVSNSRVKFTLDETVYSFNINYISENDEILLNHMELDELCDLIRDNSLGTKSAIDMIEALDGVIDCYYIHLTGNLLDSERAYRRVFKPVIQTYFDKRVRVKNVIEDSNGQNPPKQTFLKKEKTLQIFDMQLSKGFSGTVIPETNKILREILNNQRVINGVTLTDTNYNSPIKLRLKIDGYVHIELTRYKDIDGLIHLLKHIRSAYHLTFSEIRCIWNKISNLNRALIILRNVENICLDIGYTVKN